MNHDDRFNGSSRALDHTMDLTLWALECPTSSQLRSGLPVGQGMVVIAYCCRDGI